MTRQEIMKFYDNKIDDIADKVKREEMLTKLNQLYDILFELDTEIEQELEHQESDYIEDEVNDNYNYYVETVKGDIYA